MTRVRQVLTSTETQSLEVHIADSGRKKVVDVASPWMKAKKAQFYYVKAFLPFSPKQKESNMQRSWVS